MSSSNGHQELTRDAIMAALQPVQEPEIGKSIIDLKMVSSVEVNGRHVSLHIEQATPGDTTRRQLEDAIRSTLDATFTGLGAVSITFSTKVKASGSGRSDAQPIKGVKNTIAVASGKGGVGKSTVAANLAVALAQSGASVGLLDADVYGPSIPLMFGTNDKPLMRNNKIVPIERHGVHLMSIGFILDPEKALIWRGPLVAQLINQFLNDVEWGELDYLIIDLPPGTGDVQLTLVQKIPISGAVIVTTPQEVAVADAVKGLKMFQEVKTPVLGIVENMSGFVCPNCNEIHDIFGTGGGKDTAEKYEVELLGQVPIEPAVRIGGDDGVPVVATHPESVTGQAFAHLARRAAARLAADAISKPRKPTIMLKTVR
ncbi:MAG: iron-sulfur cluster carrier protein ApbC [Thermomicrobiales bacterium]|nr:iron-sulfur cluster carrier protein ApbC [Thermomicrobiales bacterium]